MGKFENPCLVVHAVPANEKLRHILSCICPRCGSGANFRNARLRFNCDSLQFEVFSLGHADICGSCGHVVYRK